jgi:hypothetical protein
VVRSVTEKLTVRKEERTKAEGLTLEELEAQGVGGLLPSRIEMKRKRKRGGHNGAACNGLLGCVGVDVL